MNKPTLRKSDSVPPTPSPAPADELDNDEIRRRLQSAGQGLGYDRIDGGGSAREPTKRLALDVPRSVHDQVRLRAANERRTINSLVLELLANAGIDVPPDQLIDDRRKLR